MEKQNNSREPQLALTPLEEVQSADVDASINAFDAWLRSISDDMITLDRIKTVAGGLPVVGNIMALIDVFNDIVELSKKNKRELLDYVSLGINLIGVIPVPPQMAAARMSLRPALYAVRQEIKLRGTMALSDSLLNLIQNHLNARNEGELDKFVATAQSQLDSMLSTAANYGQQIVTQLSEGLVALATGDLNAAGSLKEGVQQLEKGWHDPNNKFENIFGALVSFQNALGKAAANKMVGLLLPKSVGAAVIEQAEKIKPLGAELSKQIIALNDPAVMNSIGYFLLALQSSVRG